MVFLRVFPLLLPYAALAINILILRALSRWASTCCSATPACCPSATPRCSGGGAYAAGIAIVHYGAPWWSACRSASRPRRARPVAIGLFAIRTRGIYFAMVTLALSQCVYYIAYQAVR